MELEGSSEVRVEKSALVSDGVLFKITKLSVSIDGSYLRSKVTGWLSAEPDGEAPFFIPIAHNGQLELSQVGDVLKQMLDTVAKTVVTVIQENKNEF